MDISHKHAVVWMDHHEARVIHFNRETSDEEVVAPVDPPHRLHIRSGSASGTHIRGDPAFFRDVAEALGATEAVLGDVVVVNDPFVAGAHLPDITLLAPAFIDGVYIAHVATRAHHFQRGRYGAGLDAGLVDQHLSGRHHHPAGEALPLG